VVERKLEDKETKRRTRFDIITDILKASVDGANKTRIVYSTNLNFKIANEYIKFLIESNLLKEESQSNSKLYRTTEEGLELLKKFDELEQVIKLF